LHQIVGLTKENIKILDKNYCDIEQELDSFNPDMIGFTSMTVEYGKVIEFAKKIIEKHNVPFIIGGVHISTLPESFDRVFDVGIIGEGEKGLAEIVNLYLKKGIHWKEGLEKIKGIVYSNAERKLIITAPRPSIKNLDTLPIPDFTFVSKEYFKKEEIPSISAFGIKAYLISSRSCPFSCVFCSTRRFWGNVRFNSPEYTAKMLKKIMEDTGGDYVKVMDDLFTVSAQRVKELREAFEKEGIMDKITGIECQPRVNLVTEELCEEMKKIKITTVNFGFESGSDKMLQWLKAGSATVEMNRQAVLMCVKHGFNVYGSLMYGSPGETIEDMKMTNDFIDFARKNGARYLWSFVATPFPATPFWDTALQRGKVSNDMNWELLGHHCIDTPLLLDDNIDKEEFKQVFLEGRAKLRKMKIKMVKDFLFKNPFKAIGMFLKEPKYYSSRLIKQVMKQ